MGNSNVLDLKGHRCPAAMIYTRRGIEAAINNSFAGEVTIRTIEPSFNRDLIHFVSTLDNSVEIAEKSTSALTGEIKAQWIDDDDANEDELEGIDTIYEFKLIFNG